MEFIHLVKTTGSFIVNLKEMLELPEFSSDKHRIICVNKAGQDTNFEYYEGNMASAINFYTEKADMVFVHDFLMENKNWFIVKRKKLRKVVWVEWGHDLYFDITEKATSIYTFIRKIYYKIIFLIKKYKLSNVYGIGMPHIYDGLEARRLLGKKPKLFLLNYCSVNNNNNIKRVNLCNGRKIGLLVGHSAFDRENHIKILKYLNGLDCSNIKVILPLNYGSIEYRDEIVNYLKKYYKYEYEVLYDFMQFDEYWEYINKNVDIAICDATGQTGLGNLFELAELKKKIYINKQHVFYLRYIFESDCVYTTDDFFSSTIEKISDCSKVGSLIDYPDDFCRVKRVVNGWKVALEEIKKETNGRNRTIKK